MNLKPICPKANHRFKNEVPINFSP